MFLLVIDKDRYSNKMILAFIVRKSDNENGYFFVIFFFQCWSSINTHFETGSNSFIKCNFSTTHSNYNDALIKPILRKQTNKS